MADRLYDLVVYGASGFVGRQVVQYLSSHPDIKPIRWAVAGRSRQKLEAVCQQIGGRATAVDRWVADCQDQETIDRFVSQARVVINIAGPFAKYGTAVVDACVRLKTAYVDITGETPWVRELIDRYHLQAADEGTRIIPFCGFDSVPSDLGAYLVAQYLRKLGQSCTAVKAYFQAQGGFNGGTLASGLNLYESNQANRVSDPFLLNPVSLRPHGESTDPVFPEYDSDIAAWVGPFFMGAINTRVVRRSSALYAQWHEPYGPDFSYQEYMKLDEPFGWLKAASITAGLGLIAGAMQLEPGRQLLRSLGPQPGQGPSEETMNQGWFRCDLIGQSQSGTPVYGVISGQGDPGNRATVKFLCESALCLVLNQDELPGEKRGGILTPATALGDPLARRLRAAGIRLEVSNQRI
jgi:short subunit dehydrogenase-like uncharacterized protein